MTVVAESAQFLSQTSFLSAYLQMISPVVGSAILTVFLLPACLKECDLRWIAGENG